jgi:hypothetical protein
MPSALRLGAGQSYHSDSVRGQTSLALRCIDDLLGALGAEPGLRLNLRAGEKRECVVAINPFPIFFW